MCGGNSDITTLPIYSTLCCILNVVGAKLKVSFDVPNSLAIVLGFHRSTYGVGRHASEQLVNIMSVNSILVHCNIIHYSYMRGGQASVVCNIFPTAAPGQRILAAPSNLIYLPVTVDVHSNSVCVANGSPQKAAGSTLTIRFHLRECKQHVCTI